MRLKILLIISGLLIFGSGSYLAVNTGFKPKPTEPPKVVGFENLDKEATKSAEPKKEEKKDKQTEESVGEISGVTTQNIAQLQQDQSQSNNQTQAQQNPAPQPNPIPPPEDNFPSAAYCNSQKSYLDSQYQADVTAENRDYERQKSQIDSYYESIGAYFSGAHERALGELAVEHNARLASLKRTYDYNINHLTLEGCSF